MTTPEWLERENPDLGSVSVRPQAGRERKMKISIHLSNRLMAEAVHQLLVTNGYDDVVVGGESPPSGSSPYVLLVDSATLRQDLLARDPTAKVLLIDTGLEPERLCATLLSYRIHGVLSSPAQLHLFKKALKAVSEGQIWIDDESLRVLLEDTGAISRPGKISGVTDREKEIIECICQGLSNKEIARRLALSEHTVKSHLHTIFRKCNVTTRSKLIRVVARSPLAGSTVNTANAAHRGTG
jgi:DNA-binding NarL/FixJ family response regulator